MAYLLQRLLTEAAARQPQRPAVASGGCLLTYRELDRASNKVARALLRLGVAPGDRVAILAPKSAAAVIGIYGALKAGACYVPLDPKAPAGRLRHIVADSGAAVIVADEARASQAATLAGAVPRPPGVVVAGVPGRRGPEEAASVPARGAAIVPWTAVAGESGEPLAEERAIETDLAYILYTSGSTGTPKGVMISHRNSLTFVDWAAAAAGLGEQDRVCSPAPLTFDLSVFDIFAACRAAACLTVLPEGAATFPVSIARWLEAERVSVWYSVPSVLTLLACYGSLQPVRPVGPADGDLRRGGIPPQAPRPADGRAAAPPLPQLVRADRDQRGHGVRSTRGLGWRRPAPIGKACANTEVFAVTSEGGRVSRPGEVGELYVRGPSLMRGYWGQPAKTGEALVRDPFRAEPGELVYRTGDLVTLEPAGNYAYLGRRDTMVKIRGYRVELGEVEATLYRHPAIGEAAVLPVPDELLGNRLRAVITADGGSGLTREDVLDHCRRWLPGYMVPDIIELREEMPRTSTGKVDRAGLTAEQQHELEPAGDGRRDNR